MGLFLLRKRFLTQTYAKGTAITAIVIRATVNNSARSSLENVATACVTTTVARDSSDMRLPFLWLFAQTSLIKVPCVLSND